MDKATYDAFRILLVGYFQDGGTLENAKEAVQAAWLDHQQMQKRDDRFWSDAHLHHNAVVAQCPFCRAESGGGSK